MGQFVGSVAVDLVLSLVICPAPSERALREANCTQRWFASPPVCLGACLQCVVDDAADAKCLLRCTVRLLLEMMRLVGLLFWCAGRGLVLCEESERRGAR